MKAKFPKVKIPNIGTVLNPAIGKSVDIGEALRGGVSGVFDKVNGTFDTGFGLLQDTLGGIPFFGATATSKLYDHGQFDEKHYFLIPDEASDEGYALYVLRCLPEGVPPINDLTKRRVLHLPSEAALPMLEHIVIKDARQRAETNATSENFIRANLDNLINEIDNVDGKVFNGVLLVGGLVAFINPLAGATLAAKALVPSIGLMVSKYGLKFVSEKATNMDVATQIKRAEKDVKKQFKAAKTVSVVNPILHHVDVRPSLDMWMIEPKRFEFSCATTDFSQGDIHRLTDLTYQAVTDVVKDEDTRAYLDQVTEIIRGSVRR